MAQMSLQPAGLCPPKRGKTRPKTRKKPQHVQNGSSGVATINLHFFLKRMKHPTKRWLPAQSSGAATIKVRFFGYKQRSTQPEALQKREFSLETNETQEEGRADRNVTVNVTVTLTPVKVPCFRHTIRLFCV